MIPPPSSLATSVITKQKIRQLHRKFKYNCGVANCHNIVRYFDGVYCCLDTHMFIKISDIKQA